MDNKFDYFNKRKNLLIYNKLSELIENNTINFIENPIEKNLNFDYLEKNNS